MALLIVFVSIPVVFSILMWRAGRCQRERWLKPYTQRPCTGFQWWDFDPGMSKEMTRTFLRVIVKSLGIRAKNCCIIRPDDRVGDLLVTMRSFWVIDNGFIDDNLAIALERHYQFDLDAVSDPEITFGQLYRQCLNR